MVDIPVIPPHDFIFDNAAWGGGSDFYVISKLEICPNMQYFVCN